jgi:hypothetical protein
MVGLATEIDGVEDGSILALGNQGMSLFLTFIKWSLMLLVTLFYLIFAIAIGISVFKHQKESWGAGLFMASLLISLPLWVFGLYWLLLQTTK